MALADSGRISSDKAMYPANGLSLITNTTVSVSFVTKPSGSEIFFSFKYPGLTNTIFLPELPQAPFVISNQ